jgi:oxygen-dependent protoporphyrinogen oxidase
VVVVGAGISGLCCAWRLIRAGYDVEVLESELEPGGRMRPQEVALAGGKDIFVDPGAPFLGPGHSLLGSLARSLEIGDLVRRIDPPRYGVVHQGRVEPLDLSHSRGLLRAGFLTVGARMRALRLGLELARLGKNLDPGFPERALALDSRPAGPALDALAGSEITRDCVAPIVEALHPGDIEEQSLAAIFLVLQGLHRDSRYATVSGGIGRIPAELASRLPIRLGCRVSSIESQSDGVRLRYRVGGREGSVVADAAVVAVPGDRVPELCPKLTPGERGFFEALEFTQGIVAHLLLDRAPHFGWDLLAFPRRAGFGIASLMADRRQPELAPEGTGLLRAVLREGATQRLGDASDDEVRGLILDNLMRSGLADCSAGAIAVQRPTALAPKFVPGHFARLQRFRNRNERSARLAFCGDYLMGPFADAGLASGLRAASDVVRSLESS